MANTLTANTVVRDVKQFQGAFKQMWTVTATFADQDAITDGDTASFTITAPGVALGDCVIAAAINNRLYDGTDAYAQVQASVSAANTIEVQVYGNTAAFAADVLNAKVLKCLVGRPNW